MALRTIAALAAEAGATGSVSVTVTRAGSPVTDLQPYLGSFGQAVAAHVGDLAFAYMQPQGNTKVGTGRPSLTFAAAPGESGSWRLFLEFQTAGTVHTTAITIAVS